MLIATCLKKFVLVIIPFYLISCEKPGEVKLEVQNQRIKFVNLPPNRGEYNSNDTRNNAGNIITYSLTNTTNKKLLFMFDPQEIGPSVGISSTTQFYGYVGFTITDRNDSIKMFYPHMPMWKELSNFFGCDLYLQQKKSRIYAKLGVKPQDIEIVNRFINNSFVLYPGEIRTFKALLHLPIVLETDRTLQKGGIYYPELEEDDIFNLFYYCKAAELKKSLPKYIQEELIKNQIEIFDGELKANPVKLFKL